MEARMDEIMRSLGRIEQKTDSNVSSLFEIKDSIKEHGEQISQLKTYQDTQKGETKITAIIWGSVVSVIVGGLEYLIFKK